MPPHCDTMDGPVVAAAKLALEERNVNLILPWAPKKTEPEIKKAFEKTIAVRKMGGEAKELADYWFFETVVRLHREGEGAPYTGLRPAGLDEGPAVPLAEKALEEGDPKEVILFLSHTVGEETQKKFRLAMSRKNYDENDVNAARGYVEAMLGFVLYSHHLYQYIKSGRGHGAEAGDGHEH